MKNLISLYADGACRNNQSEHTLGGYGAILKFNDNKKELKYATTDTTNNRMEISAVLSGLNAIKDETIKDKEFIINIYSDSSYVINCLDKKWFLKWQKNGWKTANKDEVKNKDLWETLIKRLSELQNLVSKINYYHINGHIDINKDSDVQKNYSNFLKKNNLDISLDEFLFIAEKNNRADNLANEAMDSY